MLPLVVFCMSISVYLFELRVFVWDFPVWVCVCVCLPPPPAPQSLLGRSPVPAVLIISVWRRLAQFSRNRGLVSFPHTHTHSHSLTHTHTHKPYFNNHCSLLHCPRVWMCRCNFNTLILNLFWILLKWMFKESSGLSHCITGTDVCTHTL